MIERATYDLLRVALRLAIQLWPLWLFWFVWSLFDDAWRDFLLTFPDRSTQAFAIAYRGWPAVALFGPILLMGMAIAAFRLGLATRLYTGGPLQLADLTDHGVRYAGLTGVEWQGWLRAREAGRYQLDVDGSTVSPNDFTFSTCIFAGWLEDRSIGIQEAKPRANVSQPAAFSLILGAELQPGLYKLRLWATCTPTPSLRNQRVSIALLEKTPSDLNLRPITGEDLAHKQR